MKEKAFAARSKRDVRNPIGFLLSTVPPVFDGHGIVSYRRMIAAEAEAVRRKEEERRQVELVRKDYHARQRLRLEQELSQPGLTESERLDLQRCIRACQRVEEEPC